MFSLPFCTLAGLARQDPRIAPLPAKSLSLLRRAFFDVSF
jgi:hypothetical protein